MSEREHDFIDYIKNALEKIEGGSTNIFLLKQDLERIIEWKTERDALKAPNAGIWMTNERFDFLIQRAETAEGRLRAASDEFKRVRYSLESCKHCVTIIEALEHLKSAELVLSSEFCTKGDIQK